MLNGKDSYNFSLDELRIALVIAKRVFHWGDSSFR